MIELHKCHKKVIFFYILKKGNAKRTALETKDFVDKLQSDNTYLI